MAQHLVIYLEDGKVRRAMADFETGTNCLIVYANPQKDARGLPWVRQIEWPARARQKVLLQGLAVEYSPEEVDAVVHACEASRVGVMNLLDADLPSPEQTPPQRRK